MALISQKLRANMRTPKLKKRGIFHECKATTILRDPPKRH
jgi:hypothetical protein